VVGGVVVVVDALTTAFNAARPCIEADEHEVRLKLKAASATNTTARWRRRVFL